MNLRRPEHRIIAEIPVAALNKAEQAYGEDIARKVVWVVNRLQDHRELREAARSMGMEEQAALDAIAALRRECQRVWPQAWTESGKA